MGLKFMERDEKILYIQDLIEPYKKAFGTGVDLYRKGERPAVLVIDIQNGMVSPKSIMGPQTEEQQVFMDDSIKSCKILFDEARKRNVPIIYFGVCFRKDGLDGGILCEKITTAAELMQEGSWMVEIDDRVKPQPGDFFMWKKHNSAFAGTDLVALLTTLRVDTCVVVGNSTSGCVRATVGDSVAHGFKTVVPEECVADRGIWAHKANLFDMWAKIADVASLEDVLAWIKML